MPNVCVHSHCGDDDSIPVDWLERVGNEAIKSALSVQKGGAPPLATLEEVEVSVVSDNDIARVHGEFLEDPTPTDVITFHHGEILISADTAERQGGEHGHSRNRELALYLIHGLLHLAGWDDHEPAEAAEMARHQESILIRTLESIEIK